MRNVVGFFDRSCRNRLAHGTDNINIINVRFAIIWVIAFPISILQGKGNPNIAIFTLLGIE